MKYRIWVAGTVLIAMALALASRMDRFLDYSLILMILAIAVLLSIAIPFHFRKKELASKINEGDSPGR